MLCNLIGLIPQRAYLFTGTVASNLRYGNPEATDAELWQALEIAQASDFVAAMPDGLDSAIAQGGTNVSGGQRQRLAIARALVRRPKIYLFDDSFSALDLGTDARLRAALRPLTAEATVLIVAQRVSTIMDAEQILVLEDGRIVGRGTHAELVEKLPHLSGDRRFAVHQRRAAGRPDQGGRPMTAHRDRTAGDGMSSVQAPARPRPPMARGPFAGMGAAEKSLNFGPSFRRLLGRLAPERFIMALRADADRGRVVLNVLGPRLLGHATNIIFDGVLGRGCPPM